MSVPAPGEKKKDQKEGQQEEQGQDKVVKAAAWDDEDEGELPPVLESKADEPNAVVNVGAEYEYPEMLNSETLVEDLKKTFKDATITNSFDEHYDPSNKEAADERLTGMYSKDAKSLFRLARAHAVPSAVGLDNDADIEREILAAANCFGSEIKEGIEQAFENAKENGKTDEFIEKFFKNVQSSIDIIKEEPIVQAYESTNALKERVLAVKSSSASLSAAVLPSSTAPLRLSPEPTTRLADTAVCSTEKILVTDKAWEEIKKAIKVANPSESLEMSTDDNTIYLKKANIDIQRKEHGVQVSTTINPPDHEALVKNYKIAAGILKQKTCLIASSPSAENTAKLILELTKEPSIKPVITDNKILQALKDSTIPECIEAYSKLDIKKPKLKM